MSVIRFWVLTIISAVVVRSSSLCYGKDALTTEWSTQSKLSYAHDPYALVSGTLVPAQTRVPVNDTPIMPAPFVNSLSDKHWKCRPTKRTILYVLDKRGIIKKFKNLAPWNQFYIDFRWVAGVSCIGAHFKYANKNAPHAVPLSRWKDYHGTKFVIRGDPMVYVLINAAEIPGIDGGYYWIEQHTPCVFDV